MAVHIITDSASDIVGNTDPRLSVVPLSVTFGDTVYRDGVDLTQQQFYKMLVSREDLPTTSQVTPYAFALEIDRVLDSGEEGDEVVVLTLSSKLSGTYQSAVEAAEGNNKVQVIDTLNVSLGERAIVEYAMRLVDEGYNASQIAARIMAVRDRVRVLALLDTLEYLKRGGRVSKFVGTMGELLSYKPIVGVVDGEVVMVDKARGTKKGRILMRKLIEREGLDTSMPVRMGYAGFDDYSLRMFLQANHDAWENSVAEEDLPIDCVGATIGTHVGPGAIGIAFFTK